MPLSFGDQPLVTRTKDSPHSGNSKSLRSCAPKWGPRPSVFYSSSRESMAGLRAHVGGVWSDRECRDLRNVLSIFAKRSYLVAETDCFCLNERFLRFLLRSQHEPPSPGAPPRVGCEGPDLLEKMRLRKPTSKKIWINFGDLYRGPSEISLLGLY